VLFAQKIGEQIYSDLYDFIHKDRIILKSATIRKEDLVAA